MNFKIIFFITILALTTILSGCGENVTVNSNVTPNKSTNAPVNSTVNSNTEQGNVITTVKKTPEPTTNEAPTVTPVFKAYCDAMTKKDEAAIRKVYSSDTLKDLEAQMKRENEKSLVSFLELEQVSNKVCEVRNEKIEGDKAIAEVKTEGMPNGVKILFVKENGEWKLTNRSPIMDGDKKSSENSNSGK